MGQTERVWRVVVVIGVSVTIAACSRTSAPPPPSLNATPGDVQHQGITTPHGDHQPHHGGLVLMNGDVHYEVVFDPTGRHRVWFSDAVREDLPASIARDVRMTVARPGQPAEALELEIDDSGESWIARGRPVTGENVMAKVTYTLAGVPHEVEIPLLAPGR